VVTSPPRPPRADLAEAEADTLAALAEIRAAIASAVTMNRKVAAARAAIAPCSKGSCPTTLQPENSITRTSE
jgi:multidrug resistance efflux pump